MRATSRLKPSSPPGPPQLSPIVRVLREAFASRGLAAYLVGGAVRDGLLDKETGDIDVSVQGKTSVVGPELAALVDGRFIVLDAGRDLSRIVTRGEGAGHVIDLSPLKGGIEQDLGRRDFTLDAMAVPLSEPESPEQEPRLLDPWGGFRDLREGVVRAVTPSVFADDAARLLRGPRLSAQLGFRLEAETARSIGANAQLISNVAPERVRDEVLKILSYPRARDSLLELDRLGLLCLVLPVLAGTKDVVQPKEHQWDVFRHSVETVGQVERIATDNRPPDDDLAERTPSFSHMDRYFGREAGDGHTRMTLLKLAGLLHDIGKPATKTVEATGRIRFLGHHQVGAEMADRTLSALRMSRKAVEHVSSMVRHHLRPGQLSQDGEPPTRRALYRYYRDLGDGAVDTVYLNLADYLGARGRLIGRQEWSDRCAMMSRILEAGLAPSEPDRPHSLIDGNDIMKTFDLTPGPVIGELLELVLEAHGSGEIHTREEAEGLIEAKLGIGDTSA